MSLCEAYIELLNSQIPHSCIHSWSYPHPPSHVLTDKARVWKEGSSILQWHTLIDLYLLLYTGMGTGKEKKT